jgi:nicotinamide-nucleotide amidase
MNALIQYLKDNQLTISLAESMTGGSLAYAFVQHTGVSEVFKGSLVCYHEEAKTNILNVPKALIDTHGVVSKEVAIEMAKQAQALFKTDISMSVTGYAELDKHSYVCVYYQDNSYVKQVIHHEGTRIDIIEHTVQTLIKLCKETLFIDK